MFVIQHSKGRGHFIVTHYFTEFSVVAIKTGYTPGENNVAIVITVYIIKELVQPKMSLNREFLIWKERGA